MEKSKIDIWVGLFIVFGVLAIIFMALQASNLLNFKFDTYQVSVNFDNIGGLKKYSPIKCAGVVVGRVEKIELQRDTYQAMVTLDLDKNFKFAKDSSARILTSGFLGDQFVDISPGVEEQFLVQNDKIKNSQSALVLENLIGQFLFNKAQESSNIK